MGFSSLPRVPLAHLPTPLEEMSALGKAINVRPRLFIKRDDCTGLMLGGNKTRKLEFSMADALSKGADVIITSGAVQSNHVRQAAAASAKLGLEFHAVLGDPLAETNYTPSEVYTATGNALLNGLLNAKIYRERDDEDAAEAKILALEEVLRSSGRNPYCIPLGASDGIGSMAYAECARELVVQWAELNIRPSHIVLGTGSAGTQAGLLVGLRAIGLDTKVIGISVSEPSHIKREKVRRIIFQLEEYWKGNPPKITDADIVVMDDFVGDGYAIPSRLGTDAMRLLAKTEGILLDPVYTGKAMAGFLALLKDGELANGRDIVFLHTGGAPAFFAYPELLEVKEE
ncbi:D-cysteine desulfhydrase family protein [Hyphococcus lacteus]|uniref:D-cysteine desulfhydrase family protein n=1 Tax=Hyphococcus lacteus TaxID=3143536 RepID=A0ABV3Z3J3_9PROT